jgi:hypothetical protein
VAPPPDEPADASPAPPLVPPPAPPLVPPPAPPLVPPPAPPLVPPPVPEPPLSSHSQSAKPFPPGLQIFVPRHPDTAMHSTASPALHGSIFVVLVELELHAVAISISTLTTKRLLRAGGSRSVLTDGKVHRFSVARASVQRHAHSISLFLWI